MTFWMSCSCTIFTRERESSHFCQSISFASRCLPKGVMFAGRNMESEHYTSASDCLLATAAPRSLAASAWPSFVNSFLGEEWATPPPLPPHQGKLRCLRDWKLMSSPTKLRQTHCWQPCEIFSILPATSPGLTITEHTNANFVQWWKFHEYGLVGVLVILLLLNQDFFFFLLGIGFDCIKTGPRVIIYSSRVKGVKIGQTGEEWKRKQLGQILSSLLNISP